MPPICNMPPICITQTAEPRRVSHASYHSHASRICAYTLHMSHMSISHVMGWLRWVGSLKLYVSFAKEPYKRDDILQKRPVILRGLLIVATPYVWMRQHRQDFSHWARVYICVCVRVWIIRNVCACVYESFEMWSRLWWVCVCMFVCVHVCVYVWSEIWMCVRMNLPKCDRI